MRLGRILLRLHHEPAGVVVKTQRPKHCGEVDRAVAGNREDAVEHGAQKTRVAANCVVAHVDTNVLAMDVSDSSSVPSRDGNRIATGKHQMACIEEQRNVLRCFGHQSIDLGFRLNDRPHVMMKREAYASVAQVSGNRIQAFREFRPFTVVEQRSG